MRTTISVFAGFAAVLALAGSAAAADAMKSMPKAEHGVKTGHATGIVKAVDPKANTVTISHGPVPAVGWPAMTMAFKANPKRLASAVKPGDKVAFDVKVGPGGDEVTAIRKQ